MTNSKVLIVVTSHSELGDTGIKTGYYLSEVSHPYLAFKSSGIAVDFASIKGGQSPLDPKSLDLKDTKNKIFFIDEKGKERLSNTLKLADINPNHYQAILFAGGHGTMWDFPNSKEISKVSSSIYENGGIVASICHGPAALINIKLSNGKYLIEGKKLTAFSNAEEEAAGLTATMPFLLESALLSRGANYFKADLWKENVVVDQRLVTGQNPASAEKVAKQVIELLQ